MTDVVGLRFVTEGERETISAIQRYDAAQKALQSTSRALEDAILRKSATIQQAVTAYLALERAGMSYSDILKGAAQDERMAAQTAQQHTNALLGVERAYRSARDSAQAFLAAEQVQDNLAAGAQRWTSQLNQSLGVTGQRATALGATYARLEQVQDNLAAGAQRWTSQLNQRLGVTGQRATELGATFSALEAAQESAAREAAAEQARHTAEVEALTRAYNPLRAAVAVYERQLEQLNRAQALGVITDDERRAQLVRLQAAFDAVGDDAQQAAMFINNFSRTNTFASRSVNAMGMGMQQVGYQVGDFLVQIQSGTNAFVAFGQQATQLVGILPMFGSVMGVSGTALIGLSAGLGIAIPLLTAAAAWFMRTREAASGAAGETFAFVSALEQLETLQNRANLFGSIPAQVAAGMEPLRAFLEAGMLSQIQEQFTGFRNVITADIDSAIIDLERSIASAEGQAAALRAQFDAFGESAPGLESRMRDVVDSIVSMRENLQAQVSTYAILQSIGGQTRQAFVESFALAVSRLEREELMTAEVRESLFAFAEQNGLTRELVRLLGDAAQGATALGSAVRIAAGQANAFADAMARAASESAGIGISTAGIQAEIAALQAGASQAEARAQAAAVTLREQLYADFPTSGISPTSATSLVQQIEAEVDARRQQVLTREQAAEALQRLRQVESAGGGGGANTQSDFISRRLRELEIEREMLGLTQEQRREREIFYQLQQEYAGTAIGANETLLQQTAAQIAAQEHLNEIMQAQQRMQEQFASTAANLFIAAANGADAFRRALSQVLQQLASALANRAFRDLIMGGRGGDRGYDIVDLLIGGGSRFPSLSGGKSVDMAARAPVSISRGTSMTAAPVRLQLETRVAQDGALQTYVAGVSGAILETEGPGMVRNEVVGGGLDRPMGARFGARVSRIRR